MNNDSGSPTADMPPFFAKVQEESSRSTRRLRVMFFDHVATLSGGEIALMHLVTHLDLHAIEPVVVLGEAGPLAAALSERVEVHIRTIGAQVRNARKDHLGSSILHPQAMLAMARYILSLARFMRENRIDLVHTNSLKSDLLGGIAAKLAGKPVVWHVRDRISSDYLPAKVAQLFRLASRWLPDAIIANSHATAATLGKAVAARTHVVHDGTVLETFAPQHRASNVTHTGPASIGIVGRISPWKGQDVFLKAASIVLRSFPSAHFQIIGAALFEEAAYEAKLHQLVVELGLEGAVTFTGFVHDVPDAVKNLTILVHASTKPEPFGQVIIEGMAAAKPVVAINAGGVPEIVSDGLTGILVPINDEKRMAEAICFLLAEPEKAGEMGLRAYTHVSQHFTIQKTAAAVLDVYRKRLAL